jgi:hypothetical protein
MQDNGRMLASRNRGGVRRYAPLEHFIGEGIMAKEQGKSTSGKADRGGSTPGHAPNDDRADAKNPNNKAYEADQKNRAEQARGGG